MDSSRERRVHTAAAECGANFHKQRFTSLWTGQESLIRDHLAGAHESLPDASWLGAVRFCRMVAADEAPGGLRLRELVWGSRCEPGNRSLQSNITLVPRQDGVVEFDCYADTGEIYWQGTIDAITPSAEDSETLECRGPVTERNVPVTELGQALSGVGKRYGGSFAAVEALWLGNGTASADLVLPTSLRCRGNVFWLHPVILTRALDVAWIVGSEGGNLPSDRPQLAAIEQIVVDGRLPDAVQVSVRAQSGADGLTRDLAISAGGRILAKLSGVKFRTDHDIGHEGLSEENRHGNR